ncbi:hypothetical protein D1007_16073 [Hordeum vulgare]|nr:hypothetical protein D1007_16073 [Hordeum vulgare]
MNIALLTKWLWRIANGDGGLWLDIISSKYIWGQPVPFCQRSRGSQLWQSVIQLLRVLRIGSSISIGSGSATLFWFDRWAGELSFAVRFPAIAPEALTDVWGIRLPLKIRIFQWQWIRGRVPSRVEVLKRNGRGDGICPLCDVLEDSNHIFFTCVIAQFLWSFFCDTIDGQWCHTNVPNMVAAIKFVPSSARHIRWLTIGMLMWTLWTIRKKLVLQRVPLRHATDPVFKMCGFLQLWRPLSRSSDRDAINNIIVNLHLMALRMARPLPPPPREPD